MSNDRTVHKLHGIDGWPRDGQFVFDVAVTIPETSTVAGGHCMMDVIVVGAGPAGSATAIGCARRGLRVLLLDRARFPRDKVCGDFLNPRCWEAFERLGVAECIQTLPHHETPGFLFSTVNGRVIQVEFAEEIQRKHRCVAVSRRRMDHVLVNAARTAGVEAREDATVVGLRREGSWCVEFIGPNGHERVLAPTLVGADGRHSFVGRQVGLLVREATDDRVGMQFIVRCSDRVSDCIQLHQLADGYCGVVKLGGGLANICMVTPGRLAARAGFDSLLSNRMLAECLDGAVAIERPRRIAPILGAEFRPCGEGVLLVGDAARVLEPFTGQGICFALRSGELAAEAINRGDLRGYADALDAEYRAKARTNRLLREVLGRNWAVRSMARVAGLRPRWMEAIVGSVIG